MDSRLRGNDFKNAGMIWERQKNETEATGMNRWLWLK